MTYESAAYFRLLLLCGDSDELRQYVDEALETLDPLPDIILDLVAAGSDDKKTLSALNAYLLQAKDSDIDYDGAVFDRVLSFLRGKYQQGAMPMDAMTDLMYRLALHTERFYDEPWHTMYCMDDLWDGVRMGWADPEDYQRKFDAFLFSGICFRNYPPNRSRESFFKRLIKRLQGKA